ncbi:MAG: SGNH/GDSL hydrolase family protein [Leptolyngbyaceae cyanobacterium bins.349]|nr:SGNH/GDSL hydrolase family protein [Leptolyngbyaceae cyanobacterium bins.349]
MRKFFGLIALAILTFTVAIVFATERPQPINQLYVFGDSLSDTGVVFRATGGAYPPNPPYFQGRYSNGRVWVEYLAERLQLPSRRVSNFACGGATAVSDRKTLVPGLLTQVQSFVGSQTSLPADALYVLWAGANDYLQGTTDVVAPVESITQSINQLANVGAKQILVGNLPDLGQLPSTLNRTQASQLSRLSQAHNQALRRALKQMSQQVADLQIATLDASTLYRDAIAQPSTFGFQNVSGHCLVGVQSCRNPDQFLFWDGIHPTTAAHRHLGAAAHAALQASGIGQPRSALLP